VELDVLKREGEALIAYARSRGAQHIICCSGDLGYTLVDPQSSRCVTRQELEKEIIAWSR
jgi:hypothetical protein